MARPDPPDLGHLALRYVAERKARGEISPDTATGFRKTLCHLIESFGDGPPRRLTRHRIERWLERKSARPSSKRTGLTIVRTWCKWLVLEGYLTKDPTARIASIRQPKYLPRGLPAEAVAATFARCPDERAVLLVSLMVQEGLRCCEVARLEVGDVDLDNRLVLVRGKGGTQRVLPLSNESRFALLNYLSAEPSHHGPLIHSRINPTKGISAAYVSDLVGRWMTESGVKATAHALRHTMATDMLRGGAHVRDVQQALGHVELSSTQVYLPWLVGELRDAMGGRNYRGTSIPQ